MNYHLVYGLKYLFVGTYNFYQMAPPCYGLQFDDFNSFHCTDQVMTEAPKDLYIVHHEN